MIRPLSLKGAPPGSGTDYTFAAAKPARRFRPLWGARRGHAAVEVALLSPWIFFLFMGALDMGFYTHALIATQNAARAAAAYTSRSSSTAADAAGACKYALAELKAMSNVRNLASCNATPLVVKADAITDADGQSVSSVSVTYLTNRLIAIPGLAGQITVSRTVQMIVK